ncbi:hypothetical protein KV541_05710 [Halobacterium salinarum]|nr:hypothetical protein [Halobacterium salinarum]MCF2167651.1 hypothetical protein [Halobacterium salinarum]
MRWGPLNPGLHDSVSRPAREVWPQSGRGHRTVLTAGVDGCGMSDGGNEYGSVSAVVDELHARAASLAENGDALGVVFPPSFMQRHTDAESFEAFMAASQWSVSSRAEFAAIPEAAFDEYVAARTSFSDFEAMLGQAGEEWMARQLGV